MTLSSVIEKCISIVTGKGSESEQADQSQEQNYEQNIQETPVDHPAEQVHNPEMFNESEMQ